MISRVIGPARRCLAYSKNSNHKIAVRTFIKPTAIAFNNNTTTQTIQQETVEIDTEKVENENVAEEVTAELVESDESDAIYSVSLDEAIKTIKESGIEENSKINELEKLMQDLVFRNENSSVFEKSTTTGQQQQANTGSTGKRQFPYLETTKLDEPYSEQELYLRDLYHSKTSGKLGSHVRKVYRPQQDIKSPDSITKIGINTLMAATCHMGHSTSLWRPSTQPFIYGEYKGIHIIDLDKTLQYLKKACKVIEGVAERNGIIVYVGTRKGQRESLIEAANRSGGFYVASKWIQGNITNAVNTAENWTRKEYDMEEKDTNRELDAFELVSVVKPDLIVLLNPTENRRCIREALLTRIPTIGLCDTDCEPSLLTYPIPSNDDSLRATNLMVGVLSKAAEVGRGKRLDRIRSYKEKLGLSNTDTAEGVTFA